MLWSTGIHGVKHNISHERQPVISHLHYRDSSKEVANPLEMSADETASSPRDPPLTRFTIHGPSDGLPPGSLSLPRAQNPYERHQTPEVEMVDLAAGHRAPHLTKLQFISINFERAAFNGNQDFILAARSLRRSKKVAKMMAIGTQVAKRASKAMTLSLDQGTMRTELIRR
jgi:hypothetical protein